MNAPKPKDVRYVCLRSLTNKITHYADVGSMSACIFLSIHTCVCSCFHIMDSGLVLSEKQITFFFFQRGGGGNKPRNGNRQKISEKRSCKSYHYLVGQPMRGKRQKKNDALLWVRTRNRLGMEAFDHSADWCRWSAAARSAGTFSSVPCTELLHHKHVLIIEMFNGCSWGYFNFFTVLNLIPWENL